MQYCIKQVQTNNNVNQNAVGIDQVKEARMDPIVEKAVDETIQKSFNDSSWGKNTAGFESIVIDLITETDSIGGKALDTLINKGFIPVEIVQTCLDTESINPLKEYLMNRNDGSEYRSLTEAEYAEFLELFNKMNGFDSKGNLPVNI